MQEVTNSGEPQGDQSLKAELAAARETIRKQGEEVARLQRRLEGERLGQDLRDGLMLAANVSAITAPMTHSRLLDMVVQVAAHVISAQAASLFLIDEATEELIFEVALGQKADEIKKYRIPLGHGIAGLVAVSGQPIAISNAQQDP